MFSLLRERYFMSRIIFLYVFLSTISAGDGLDCIGSGKPESILSNVPVQDTIKKRQILYNGIVWKNIYHGFNGDQFFLSDWFLSGEVSINGQTFNNLIIKYDIYSDEIMIPLNRDEIVQLNKEMVDSFTIRFEDKLFKFINIRNEASKGFTGYVNVLYKGKSALFVKYKKEISHYITEKKFGEFYEKHQIYFMKDSIIYLIKTRNDLFKILDTDNVQIKKFVSHNKLRVSKKIPESFIPVIRYYDSLGYWTGKL